MSVCHRLFMILTQRRLALAELVGAYLSTRKFSVDYAWSEVAQHVEMLKSVTKDALLAVELYYEAICFVEQGHLNTFRAILSILSLFLLLFHNYAEAYFLSLLWNSRMYRV